MREFDRSRHVRSTATFRNKVFLGLSIVCNCVQAHEATNLMRQSIREEHALKLDFLSTVLKHVSSSSPTQE